ncbi:NDP-sugar synthase [Bacteroides sp. 214]|uniref:NTP transferase domain-containing protein n=1 Tax=Bacteroides sp. 214 TaxID=2302935 RepID=UPI0013D4E029|nr:NTP transferase domain-containing protein [Bacteroides sp. 214]NDW12429.1 NDP-sugar synthase [Bacteroides sp. 214]
MNFAVIAAGQGSRLVAEGVGVSKPLLEINGEKMIERLFRIFLANGATSISVIINEEMTDVRQFLQSLELPIPFNLIIKSTPDSLHSFYELSRFLEGGKFCLTTVDPIFREEEFAAYIEAFRRDTASDAFMAVTDYIDDEKPLYVQTDEALHIVDFLDQFAPGVKYVSGGVYGMNERVLALFQQAMQEGLSRMRNFQRMIVRSGLQATAYPFSKIIDVDHESDIKKAQLFIQDN